MRVLVSWLGDYIEWTGKPRELARVLTEVGLTVPTWEDVPADATSPADGILEVEVPSNRGDCLSHLGVAREVAAATAQPFRSVVLPEVPRREADAEASTRIQISVEAPDLCPAYCARVIGGVDNRKPTPAWIARRLGHLGLRPSDPVVDATNFILLARGQPLHAFDLAKLRGGRIVVRRSRAGEEITTLDGRRRTLPAGLLVIADAERPVAVAGVMGSRDAEVGPGTTEVVVESARFLPSAVRASAEALGMATDASARFSRRVDPTEIDTASLRSLVLMADATGGLPLRGAVRAGPEAGGAPAAPEIRIRVDRLRRLLGAPVPAEEVRAVMAALRMEVVGGDAAEVRVRPPSWRGDVAREEDLVEEVARVRGYSRIPTALSLPVRPVAPRPADRALSAARAALAGEGWLEALTLPFVAPGAPDDASPWTDRPAIRVDNPTRAEEPLLRRSLLGPLLRCLERNRARGVEGARLFEIGVAFLPAAEGPRPEERRLASGIAEGRYADARGALDALAAALGLEGRLVPEAAPAGATIRPLEPARSACFRLDGAVVAWAGEIAGADLAGLGVHREGLRAAAFEADLDALLRVAEVNRPARPIPVHPRAVRDLAFVLPLSVRWADLERAVRGAGGPLLRSVELFDEFRGRGVPEGSRSLAFRMTFGADDRTLRGEEVDAAVAAVAASVGKDLGGRLRA